MDQRFSKMSPQPWAQVALLLGLCFVIYFVNLGQWDLWNPDEPRYAEVSREMVNGGDWILMHRNGNLYTDKPPLFFWAVAISSFLWQGFTPFSVRFPSALFGTLDRASHFFHWEEALFITHRIPLRAHPGDEFSICLSFYTGQYRYHPHLLYHSFDSLFSPMVSTKQRGRDFPRRNEGSLFLWILYRNGLGYLSQGTCWIYPPLIGALFFFFWFKRIGKGSRR